MEEPSPVSFRFTGNIPVKKNNYRIGRGGKGLYKPEEITGFADELGVQLMEQGVNYEQKISGPFSIIATFYVKNMAKDMDGMLTTLLDELQEFEIIEDDKHWVYTNHLAKHDLKDGEEDFLDIELSPVDWE